MFYCFIAIFKYCQLLLAQVSFNDIWRKYACKRKKFPYDAISFSLYILHSLDYLKICFSIFNSLSYLYFCERLFDFQSDCFLWSRVNFVAACVKVCCDHYFNNINHFRDDCFGSHLVSFLLKKYNLDLYFPNSHFIDIICARQNYCLFIQSCNNLVYLFIYLIENMFSLCFNSINNIFLDLKLKKKS